MTIGQRVENTPGVIVTGAYGNTANMERIMRAQTFSDPNSVKGLAASRTMELNPRHPIVSALNKLVADSPDAESTKDLAYHLYDTALLNSGFSQDDLEGFSERMYRTLAAALKVPSLELEPEVVVEDDEEEKEDKPAAADKADAAHDGAEL